MRLRTKNERITRSNRLKSEGSFSRSMTINFYIPVQLIQSLENPRSGFGVMIVCRFIWAMGLNLTSGD